MRTTHHFFCTKCRLLLVLVFVFAFIQPCSANTVVHVPKLLQPWVDWVLHDKEEQLKCIAQYNDADIYQCAWPSELEVALNDQGGQFSQSWLVHHESWVTLPGNSRHWPLDVRVDGKTRIILQKHYTPKVQLQPGLHRITGRFTWTRLPENLKIPAQSGLVSLTVNNEKIGFPNLDESGRLWLKRLQTEEKIENRLKIESFRLIEDSIPSKVMLYFTLDVAGSAREITLGPLYAPENFTPLSLKSALPARLEHDGRMLMQVRPGQYSVSVTLRHSGPLHEFSFHPPDNGFWPQQEIWSFRAQPDLRLVEIGGVPSIDPLRTSVPKDWRKYPAYRVLPGDSMRFKQIKRGDPNPAPDQMTLNRNLWLRFDGSGYSIQDRINGQKNTNWRLEIDPAITLGRVAVDGIEQFITARKGSDKAGIELRNGVLNLTADSVYQGKITNLPATGWDHDFQQAKGRLYLPPGWKLLNATGIDNIPRTWVKRWTLLDFFIVLIFTIALAKLFSKPLAGVAFLTLVLIYHEPGAPRYIWPAMLIGFALLKYLPDGAFKKAVKFYQSVAVLCFVIIVIPYSIHALRIGMYPQLAKPWTSMTDYALRQNASSPVGMQRDALKEMQSAPMNSYMDSESVGRSGKAFVKREGARLKSSISSAGSSYYGTQVMQHDPKALTQTGPGMPKWLPFETIDFSWSGPVTRDQRVTFALIGPKTNLILAFVRVFLIVFLAFGMFGIRYRPGEGVGFTGMKSLKICAFLVFFLLSPHLAQSTEIPSQQMLDELQARLLEKNECYPACSDMPDVHINISSDRLSMDINVDAQLDASIPLPSHVKHWLPNHVMIDGSPAQGLLRKENGLWMLVPAGRHMVTLSGPIRKQNVLQLPLPLRPHHVTVNAEGWSVEGVHPDGKVDAQLQFKRIVEQDEQQTQNLETGILPPFVLVERNVLLGLVWKIQTKIQRLSPTGSAVVLDIPLLPGESVTTEGLRVEAGVAKINLGAGQGHLSWESFLEPADQLQLEHKQTTAWTEIWKVDVSPIFHLEYEGIPVILHKTGTRWYPTWHPWPGETVSLNISRPAGVEGQTLTIEKSHLELRPGQKNTAAKMLLAIKSSQGGQHTITLPLTAKLQEVKIKGKIQPVRQEGRRVALPIIPGQQNIELKWVESKRLAMRYQSSDIDLGTQSVNASVDIYLPRSCWPLFIGGEQLVGPAVLFWSVLIIIVLVAFALSKTGWTPLKFYHWFLLGIGMSMSHLAAAVMIVSWLIVLDRRKKAATLEGLKFNFMQTGIVILTIAAMGSLVFAVSRGLLGHPDMNIIGNGSNSGLLRWYQDVSDPTLPKAWIFSIPMLFYRIAMLAWALWLSFWLVGILKWGWQQFTTPKLWCSLPPRIKRNKRIKKETETD
ncbi:hypothetical protein [Desulfobacula phenolica]|uniref:Uncharacterized protein n=1 Tax=Desulfobacula phenolica TaxID=90732 RepID=A0A1H2DYP2_9BACT|nr:hypothetical protein [Desulfobacula phenolica]SDT87993.1 hypothetical protein SAMN04487931_102335 [Desulfobacula phenolica]